MDLPIDVKRTLQDETAGHVREGGKNYNLDVSFNTEKLKWKSFVDGNLAADENGAPILSDSKEEAKRAAQLHVRKLLIEDGIFHEEGYALKDENGKLIEKDKRS